MRSFILALVAVAASTSGTASAQAPGISTEFGEPYIRIAQLSPPGATQLVVGQSLNMKVRVQYILEVDAGKVDVVIRDPDGNTVAQASQNATRGKHYVVLPLQLDVPATQSLTVTSILSAEGMDKPIGTDHRSYMRISYGGALPKPGR